MIIKNYFGEIDCNSNIFTKNNLTIRNSNIKLLNCKRFSTCNLYNSNVDGLNSIRVNCFRSKVRNFEIDKLTLDESSYFNSEPKSILSILAFKKIYIKKIDAFVVVKFIKIKMGVIAIFKEDIFKSGINFEIKYKNYNISNLNLFDYKNGKVLMYYNRKVYFVNILDVINIIFLYGRNT